MIKDSSENSTPKSAKSGTTHLQFALGYMSEAWFPPTPENLVRIERHLPSWKDTDRIQAIDLIKADVALFSYCAKELCRLVHSSPQLFTPPVSTDEIEPTELLRRIKFDKLKDLLSHAGRALQRHDSKELDHMRGKRLLQPLISATVSEALAPHYDLSPDMAYSCAIFRQLGLTLIAWNYPHIYSRAVASAQPGATLDGSLSKTLGFSPTMLGVSLAQDLKLSSMMRLGLGDIPLTETSAPEIRNTAERLRKLCEIGEAFARASDPDYYPKASGTWQAAATEINNALGETGFRKLITKIETACEPYLKLLPQGFKAPEPPQSTNKATVASISPARTMRANNYIRHCPPALAEKLVAFYKRLSTGGVLRDNVSELIKQIIPMTGFNGGCIFLLEPESVSLIPRLAIGQSTLAHFNPVNYTSSTTVFNPIIAAYRSRTPVMEEKYGEPDQKIAYIAGSLGENHLAGVLYLEFDPALLKMPQSNPLIHFRALRQALEDCLEIY